MSSNWDNIKNTVKEEFADVAVTTKKYFNIGKGKLEIMDKNSALNDIFQEIGLEVYNQVTEEIQGNIRSNPKIVILIDKVNELKKSIKTNELEIAKFKKGPVHQNTEKTETTKPHNGNGKKKA